MDRLDRPGRNRQITSDTAMTAVTPAWPEGNDAPLVCTNGAGGRARSYALLRKCRATSSRTLARTNVARNHHLRRAVRNTTTAARTGTVTYVLPTTLSARASQVSGATRARTIPCRVATSTRCTAASVVWNARSRHSVVASTGRTNPRAEVRRRLG